MTRCDRSRPIWFLTAASLLAGAVVACSDAVSPTAPPSGRAAMGGGGGGGGGGGQKRLTIVGLNLSSSTLAIGGAAVSYTVTVQNKGPSVSGVTFQGAIVQGAVNHPAGTFPASCPPSPSGVVPNGSCQMTFSATASNASGAGTLVPGPATFVVSMVLTTGGTPTTVDQSSAPVTLVAAAPSISSLTVGSSTFVIDSGGSGFTVVVQNPGSALSGVMLHGFITQGSTTHSSGSIGVFCPAFDGTLPSGSCTMSYGATAYSTTNEPGILVPGAATLTVKLVQTAGGSTTLLDSRSVSITLVAGPPIIYGLSLSNSTLEIGGKTESFTANLRNQGAPRNGIWLKAEVVQGSNSGIVGGRYILCPGETTIGLLPTGDCTFSSSVAVPASAPFVPGAAQFILSMYQVENDALRLLHSFSMPVTLVAAPAPPSITSLSVSPSTLVIDGPLATWTASFQNPGSALTGVSAQGYIVVGTDTVPANGVSVNCPSNPLGTLPSGSCTMSWTTAAQSSAINGDKLVPGSADFLLVLFQLSNNVTTKLASKTFPITLASGTPTITSVVFDPSVPRRDDDGTVILLISQNSSNGYTVTIDNPGALRTGMGIQAELHQGTAWRGAGGSDLFCGNGTTTPGAQGELPSGTCVMLFNTTASNFAAGNGDLTEGYADWVLYLQDAGGNNVDSKTVRVYLALQQF